MKERGHRNISEEWTSKAEANQQFLTDMDVQFPFFNLFGSLENLTLT